VSDDPKKATIDEAIEAFNRGEYFDAAERFELVTRSADDDTRRGIDVERLCAELAAYTEEVRATPRSERDGLKHRARIFLERRRAPKINLR
jgi:hypothetical protein